MPEGGSRSLQSLLLGWISLDLFVRYDAAVQFVAELLGFRVSTGIVVPIVLGTEYVLQLSTVRAVFSWGLFWIVLVLAAPLFFPKEGPVASDWTLGIPNRLLVASGAVATGLTIEGWVAVFETRINYGGVMTPTVVAPAWTPLGIIGTVLVGFTFVRGSGPFGIGTRYLPVPTPRYEGGDVTRDRYLFVVLFLGVVLALLSILFPLPELALSTFLVTDLLRAIGVLTSVGSVSLAVREDFVEALAGASLAIWRDLEETFHLIYVVAPLLWYWAVAIGTVSVVDLSATFRSRPILTTVFVGMLVAAGSHAVIYAVRLSQRIRERAIQGGELPPRVPLSLLPVGLAIAVAWLVVLPGARDGISQNAITALDLGTTLLAVALVSILLSVLPVRYPSAFSVPGPGWPPEESDHAAAAVATVVVVFGLYPGMIVTERLSRATLVLGLVTGPLTVSSLWLGPKFLLPDRSVADTERLKTGMRRGIAVIVLYLPFSGLREALASGWSPPAPVAFAAGAVVIVLGGVAGIASLCTTVFLVTFVFRR